MNLSTVRLGGGLDLPREDEERQQGRERVAEGRMVGAGGAMMAGRGEKGGVDLDRERGRGGGVRGVAPSRERS